MSDKTGISWTATFNPDGTITPGSTWNPLRGCSIVSPGCKNCYAMAMASRFAGPGQAYEGLAHKVNGHPVWTGKLMFVEKHLRDPLKWRRPRKIFVNSMSDLFHENVEEEWLDQIFDVMEEATRHTYIILTKRPEQMRDYMRRRATWWTVYKKEYTVQMSRFRDEAARLYARDNPHIWLGVSVERQREADERIPLLIETPAAVRLLSCEPLLGSVDFSAYTGAWKTDHSLFGDLTPQRVSNDKLHWVIVGGESGPGFRRMDVAWARSLLAQCRLDGIAYFYKQSSGLKPGTDPYLDGQQFHEFPHDTMTIGELQASLGVADRPEGARDGA